MTKVKLKEVLEVVGRVFSMLFFLLLIVGYLYFFGSEEVYVGFKNSQPGVYEARFPCKPDSKEFGTWVTASCVNEKGNSLSITSAPTTEAGKMSDNPEGGIEIVEKASTKLNGRDAVRFTTKYYGGFTRFYKVEHNGKTITIAVESNSTQYSPKSSELYELLDSFKLLD